MVQKSNLNYQKIYMYNHILSIVFVMSLLVIVLLVLPRKKHRICTNCIKLFMEANLIYRGVATEIYVLKLSKSLKVILLVFC